MKIGLAQINTRIGDLASNVDSILGAARAAEKADVVVFPEMVLTGYPPRDLLSDHGFITATQEALQQLAKDAKGGPTLIVGAPVPSGATTPGHPGLYNAAVLIGQGRIQGMQPKRLLPAYDVFHEPRWFVPGPSSSVFEIAGSRFGLAICEDVWDEGYPIHPPQELITQGAEWIAWVSASPYRDGVFDQRLYQAKNVSKPLVFVNAVGAHD